MSPPQVEPPRALAGVEAAGQDSEGSATSIADTAGEVQTDWLRKREATAVAALALHGGHVVHKLEGGRYLVVWRGLTRECADLDELEAHARRVGVLR